MLGIASFRVPQMVAIFFDSSLKLTMPSQWVKRVCLHSRSEREVGDAKAAGKFSLRTYFAPGIAASLDVLD
jgi:hypothetical protein